MAIIPQTSLFSWNQLDAQSDLERLRLVLSALPDEKLMALLEKQRGNGRDDYPIRPLWNALISGIVLQHPSAAALLRELWRNAELRQVCGFDPHKGTGAAPSEDAFGRFLALICDNRALLVDMFQRLVDELGKELPALGQRLAVDSKAISSAGKPVRDPDKLQNQDRRRDLDADFGHKSYRGKRADGTAWEKVVKWFGYKLHLLVDATFELPLAFSLTRASKGDSPELLPLCEQLRDRHPNLHQRAEELAADKAYDSAQNKAQLYDEHGIKPLIDHRLLWKEEPGRPRVLLDHRVDVVLYDELGRLYCMAPAERRGANELRQMAFVGFEADRNALKYRCPAAFYGYECLGRAECESLAPAGVGPFGRTVRVPLATDRRIFTPIARPTPKWQTAYARRTAVERVNARIDRVFGFEVHFIRGMAKMETRVTLALVVLLAMALGRIRAGQEDLMRSLTAPVRRAS
jgi:hypothetical protein